MFVYRKTTTKQKEIYSINKNKIYNPNIMYSKRKTTLTNVTTRTIQQQQSVTGMDIKYFRYQIYIQRVPFLSSTELELN